MQNLDDREWVYTQCQWMHRNKKDILKALATTQLHPKVMINDEVKSLHVNGRTVFYRRTFDLQSLEFTCLRKQVGVPEFKRFEFCIRIHLMEVFENCCNHFDLQL